MHPSFNPLHQRISEACSHQPFTIDELQQSYLTHLMVRYADQAPSASVQSTAIEMLDTVSQRDLRILGDECLLLCGLCPQWVGYCDLPGNACAQLGQHAYRQLARRNTNIPSTLYAGLATHYCHLITVLQTMIACIERPRPSLLQQAECWRDNKDVKALAALQAYFGQSASVPFDQRGLYRFH